MSRVLAIGDMHEPFCLEGYLEFNKELVKKYNIDRIVFIGDEIDNHFTSYHETDPDGLGGGDELDVAIEKIQKWYEAFPKADVLWGNQSRLIYRKAFSGAIPARWVKDIQEVLGTPGWSWHDRIVIDKVQYIHGEAGTARRKAKDDMMSTVQGHLHTQCYTEWMVGANYRIYGCQVGCGIDADAYALAYAKRGKKPAIGSAVILDGEVCINEMMKL